MNRTDGTQEQPHASTRARAAAVADKHETESGKEEKNRVLFRSKNF